MRAVDAQLPDGPLLGEGAEEALRAHALAEYPQECVGLLDRQGCYFPMTNRAHEPEKFAVPDRREVMARLAADDLRALCHSHPDGPDCPSESDMRAQREIEVPFVIVATNGQACAHPFAFGDELLDDRDLLGRSFRHGVQDCYSLIRLWWRREHGVLLPDFPRNWEWWNDAIPGSKDLYRRHFADAGFREIDAREARPGDVWLAAVRSLVPNHAGVYLPDGLALHHPSSGLAHDPGRLSKRESLARWQQWITHWVRRD